MTVRLYDRVENGIAKWIADQPEPKPGLSVAIRHLLEAGLKAEGVVLDPAEVRQTPGGAAE